jgi:hypothetical protein
MRALLQQLAEAAQRWPGTAALERAVARAAKRLAHIPAPKVSVFARGAKTEVYVGPAEGLSIEAWAEQRAWLKKNLYGWLPALPIKYQWRIEMNASATLTVKIETWLEAVMRQESAK